MDSDWDLKVKEVIIDDETFLIIPKQSKITSKEGEFTTFDTSYGHCGLCGSLTCKGNCFK